MWLMQAWLGPKKKHLGTATAKPVKLLAYWHTGDAQRAHHSGLSAGRKLSTKVSQGKVRVHINTFWCIKTSKMYIIPYF